MFGAAAFFLFCTFARFHGRVSFTIIATLAIAQAMHCMVATWPVGYVPVAPALELSGIGPLVAAPAIVTVNAFLWLGPVASACIWAIVGLGFLAHARH